MNQRTRLQLTWKNKDLRLLNHGASTYEWVEPRDWRVSEVRVLQELEVVGDAGDNLLIEGDALHALTSLAAIPEYAQTYKGKVKLCYIDPPFNTGQAFAHYKDSLENSVWLTMFRDRLAQIKELLAPGGTVWVHLDDVQVHRARCVLDELFGIDRHLGTVIWEKTDSPRMDTGSFSVRHDTILVYAKDGPARLNWLPSTKSNANRIDGHGQAYYLKPLRGMGGQGSTRAARPNLYYAMIDPDGGEVYPKLPDGGDGAWRWGSDRVKRDAHLIEWVNGRNGWNPYYRIYETADAKRPPETLWPFEEVGSTRNSAAEIKNLLGGTVFSTPKPERLLARIIRIATNPGDIVLDCFLGSGTTAAVAQKMGRRWVGVELEGRTVEDFIKPRLAKVMDGSDLGGVTQVETEEPGGDLPEGMDPAAAKAAATTVKALLDHGTFDGLAAPKGAKGKAAGGQVLATLSKDPAATAQVVTELIKAIRAAGKTEKTVVRNWCGGGGYRHLVVGESMFEDNSGVIVLADWATNGALAEAVAAQLRFPFEPRPPFAGKKGRQWLAVIDGMLTESLVDYLLAATESDETIVVVAQGLMPGVGDYLRAQRKGSRARKVPRDLAHRSARTERIDTSQRNGDEDQ